MRKSQYYPHLIIIGFLIIHLINSDCANRINRELHKLNQLGKIAHLKDQPYVKLHLPDGGLYILHEWFSDSSKVTGVGVLLNADRDTISKGKFDVRLTDFVIAETNIIDGDQGRSALWIMTGVSLAATVF